MRCCICGCSCLSSGKSFFAIDLPKTPNRRWACEDHVKDAGGTIPQDVKQIVDDVKDCIAEIKAN